ncbi:aldo/keto reductase [Prescottella agglutinans]|uniref:Aryl-alcohol dehydrogenase-like predicted oxidoreductase n=1 Tax=Prescottella agglutinans TaxID=1644129 RepID=A0ABT6M9C8_9NOCA|nr:aldo/keto reductase [Prescottella agglutinans]MDH6280529.1 aryl-alcohol dehydrogenase-like predicted oxidoreductase [Prescottella agglutinans]
MTVPTIELGHGLHVSTIGLGGMALSHVYGPTDPEEAVRTLHHAIDVGVTFVDTADVYGTPRPGTVGPAGTNEELVGQVLRTRRGEVQLATKFGITGVIGEDHGGTPTRGDRDYVRSACEASLRRLGTDVIDLYYMHRREIGRPIEETVGAMAELVREGKVRHLGLSEVTGDELRAAAAVHPITAVQSEWSLWSRDVERQVVPAAIEVGAGFVPYSPLGRGFLTGTLTREAVTGSILQGQHRFDEHFDANQVVVEHVRAVAAEVGATPAQVALAWLLAQGTRLGVPVAPIPGTRRSSRVDENAAAASLELSASQLERLDSVADLVTGGRNLTFNGPEWISSGRE